MQKKIQTDRESELFSEMQSLKMNLITFLQETVPRFLKHAVTLGLKERCYWEKTFSKFKHPIENSLQQ